jgi:hypothetical protein
MCFIAQVLANGRFRIWKPGAVANQAERRRNNAESSRTKKSQKLFDRDLRAPTRLLIFAALPACEILCH